MLLCTMPIIIFDFFNIWITTHFYNFILSIKYNIIKYKFKKLTPKIIDNALL